MVLMEMDSAGVSVDVTLPDESFAVQTAAHDPEPASTVAAEPETLAISEADPVSRVAPVYPDEAREANVSGTVHLLVRVDPAGLVREARVVRSDSSMLDDAALTAVRQWVFKPRPASFWVEVPIQFSLH
jgi:TonB family protein